MPSRGQPPASSCRAWGERREAPAPEPTALATARAAIPPRPPRSLSQCLNGFLAKADGKDKLTALVQYAAMFVSGGEAGRAKQVQGSVAAARKVFRVLRPLEAATPVILNPRIDASKGPAYKDGLAKLKSLLTALYFGGDHVVWASQAGIYTNKRVVDKWQKVSLYSWLGSSLVTVVQECEEVGALAATRRAGEPLADWRARQAAAAAEIDRRLFVLVHACVQALLAVGLLQLRPWRPRFVGALGIAASAMNCYLLLPALAPILERLCSLIPDPEARAKAAAEAPARPDPTTITLYLENPSGTIGTYTYANGDVVRPASGTYTFNGTATEAGYWRARWVGDGAAIAAQQGRYFVREVNV